MVCIVLFMQDAFIGFGGNIVREVVKKHAPWYVYKMQDLIDELKVPAKKEITSYGGLLHSCDTVPATMMNVLTAN